MRGGIEQQLAYALPASDEQVGNLREVSHDVAAIHVHACAVTIQVSSAARCDWTPLVAEIAGRCGGCRRVFISARPWAWLCQR